MERDGEAGGEDGCASGGRHQEQSEGDGGSSLAVMEADVLWSNGSCVCMSESVCLRYACVCLCLSDGCVCVQSVTYRVCMYSMFLMEALQFCDGCIKAI